MHSSSRRAGLRVSYAPVEVVAKTDADGEEAVQGATCIGAAMHDNSAGERCACMPVARRGGGPYAAQAVPAERGCVQHVQVIVEGALQAGRQRMSSTEVPANCSWQPCGRYPLDLLVHGAQRGGGRFPADMDDQPALLSCLGRAACRCAGRAWALQPPKTSMRLAAIMVALWP